MADRMRVTSLIGRHRDVDRIQTRPKYSGLRGRVPVPKKGILASREKSERTGASPRTVAQSASSSPPVPYFFAGILVGRSLLDGQGEGKRIAEDAAAVLGLGKQRGSARSQIDLEGEGPEARAGLGGVAQERVP